MRYVSTRGAAPPVSFIDAVLAGLANAETYYVALPYIGATGAAEPNPFAQPGGSDVLPPERHLGYALTWWGLAGALVGVYLAFHARQGRLVISLRPKAENQK